LNPTEHEVFYEILEVLKKSPSIYVDDLLKELKRNIKDSTNINEDSLRYFLMKLEILGEIVTLRTSKKGMIVKKVSL